MMLNPTLNMRLCSNLLQRFAGLIAAVLLVSAAQADTLVAPNNLATADYPFGAGTLVASNYHAQQVYGAQHFPAGIALLITELRFRPDRQYGNAFNTIITNIQVRLSTTAKNPDGLSTTDGLSATFANNIGADEVVVFSGALSMSSQFIGPPTGPKNFDMVIPLTTPFIYNPAGGNLLLDVRNISGSTASAVSGHAVPSDGGSRLGGSLSSATGGTDTGVEALQVIYTPTNAPPVPPQPTLLTRGPYLQSGTTSNILVRWRTSRLTNSVVHFGLSEASLNWAVTNAALAGEHIVTLTNLAPGTKYFYAVGAGDTNFAGGSNCFFITAPVTGQATRIWVIGDAGSANYGESFGVTHDPFGMRDAYYAYTSNRYTDVFLMLGDNAYGVGTDEEYSTNMFGTFPSILRQSVVWSAIGNHDAVNAATYQDNFSFPQNGEAGGVPSGSELYYSFNRGKIHFVGLDSEITPNTPGSAMLTWLEADLADNTNDWLIVFWHSPPYSFSSHDSDNPADSGGHLVQMRENVVPIIESYGADLVLCGHSNAYERSCLTDGHYGYSSSLAATMSLDAGSGREDDSGAYLKKDLGPAEHQGAVYTVCGCSGWVTPPTVSLNRYLKHPTTFIGLPQVGSMVLDVNSNRLDAKFLSHVGQVEDYFTILKGVGPEPLKIKTVKVAGGSVTLQFKTTAGRRYQVERATQLGPSDWQPLAGEITATGVTTKWTGAAPASTIFYRIVQVPN